MLKLLDNLGEEALQQVKEIAYQDGFNEMTNLLNKNNVQSIDNKISILSLKSSLFGYIPKIEQVDHSTHIYDTIYNCPFSEHIHNDPSFICALHEENLKDQMDALFGPNNFVQFNQMNRLCEFCEYKITTLMDQQN